MPINESIYEMASKPLISIDINEYVSNAAKFMYERGLRRLAVKQDNQIVGIFNSMSLLKILLEGSDPSNLTLSMIELESPVYINKTTSIKDSINLMNQKDVTSVLVGSPNEVLGILTTHDVIPIISSLHINKGIHDVIDRNYPKVDINDSKVIDAIDEIVNKKRSGVLILDNDEYVGTLTLRDIIKVYSDFGVEGLNVKLQDLSIEVGAYGSIGLPISDLTSIMYNKGYDVIAIFCSGELCGGIDDLILVKYFNNLIDNL